MVIDDVCEEEETGAVAGPVIASGVAPGGCDEEVCVDGSGGTSTLWLERLWEEPSLVEKRVDCVFARSEPKQRLRKL